MRKVLCFLVITLVVCCKSANIIYFGANSCCKSTLQYFSVNDEKILEFITNNKRLIILESTSGGLKSDKLEIYFKAPITQKCYEYDKNIVEVDCKDITYENFVINLWENDKRKVIDSLATSYRYSGVQQVSRIIDFSEQEMICKCFNNFESIEFEKDYLLIQKKD